MYFAICTGNFENVKVKCQPLRFECVAGQLIDISTEGVQSGVP